jgi:hypothetical protein
MIDDGRLLAIARDGAATRLGSLALLDPESGESEPIELPEWFGGRLRGVTIRGRTPSGALVLDLDSGRSRGGCHARLDLATRRLEAAGDARQLGSELVGCPDESTLLLVVGGKSLWRARFGEASMELVFPRSRP